MDLYLLTHNKPVHLCFSVFLIFSWIYNGYSYIHSENRRVKVIISVCAIAHIFCARDTFLYIAHIYAIMITENLSS